MASSQPPAFRNQARTGMFRRTPPAIFPPVMGLFGLGLAWRRGAEVAGLPGGIAEAVLGAVTLLYLFMLLAYLAKVARRPGVVAEDLRILPGRAGLAAANLSAMLLAAALVPYAPGLARAVLAVAALSHVVLGLAILRLFLTGPDEARVITPVWHLTYVGYILAPLALVPLGHDGLARAILYLAIPVALAIWAVSLRQLVTRIPPAPLRPLLAIHLAPASLFATVAAMLEMPMLATGSLGLAVVILSGLLLFGRWVTQAGFSALWGAFTFPLAACTSALLANGWAVPGLILLAASTGIILPIAFKVVQAWAKGGLAIKTNAAQA
ncbi:tellurite resistance protein [Gemmobacter megaterium]|uniref:Tellurite resistance protein n=1 Tax=Gemmobacter megaterium TaxID=1086013 RepID=A0A1N7KCG3_9RHOB|nr:tellurium resistance protein [Gemmobacter megaterium]GGE01294.1 tellurium resistance protein [Gemmobacter megaterium]SIS59124.1 tellurite resistance protein [Gemmobacter megaterium]